MVKILIGNNTSKIVGHLDDGIQLQLDSYMSYIVAGSEHSFKVKNKLWDGVDHLYHRSKGQSFYTGLLSIVCAVLKKNNIPFRKVDNRVRPEPNLPFLEFTLPEGFEQRDYQDFTLDASIKMTRGILKVATGGGKCLGEGTKIIMFDGSTKNVEDVITGDLLMGPDSTARTVRSTTVGHGPLYRVNQINGDDYICNDEHILCLQKTGSPSKWGAGGQEVQITAQEFYRSNKTFKHLHKGYKVGVEFTKSNLPIEPYFIGLWLGDGNSRKPAITTGDEKIVQYLRDFASRHDLVVTEIDGRGCKDYSLVRTPRNTKMTKKDRKNPLLDGLRSLDLIQNKHIPELYKTSNREDRLNLLAGLIDADGYATKVGAISICSVKKELANDILWLARSLGFRSSINIKKTSIKSTNYVGEAYRVRISGKISDIPIILDRRQAGDKTKYAALRYGIKVSPIGEGDYYGFEIDGDRKFLLGDFTVTHNTFIVSQIIGEIQTAPFIFYVLTKDLMDQAYDTLSNTLNVPIGRIGGGHFDIKDINVCTVQTVVRAINDKNKKFKICDYLFDDEDKWDEKDILSDDKVHAIRSLLGATKGVYLDEAHHAAAKTVREVLGASPNAYWRFGGTATPYREDNAELVLQGLFGKKIVDISASYLIKKGYLIRPYILFDPIKHDNVPKSYQSIYSSCVNKNQEFNAHVAKTANHLISRGLSILILVQRYDQGKMLKKMIPGTEFITGKTSSKKRAKTIQDLREKKTLCMIATTLADEGLDIPSLDAALLAGGGASSTRVNQRVGRTLRPDRNSDNPRDKSIVVVYDHKAKFLTKQTARTRKILKLEEEFVLINSAGDDYILGEIDDIMGTGSSFSIFDI